MTWQTMADMGLTGLSGLFIYCANVWPGFTPVFLFSLFMIALLGSYFAGKRIEGDGNIMGALFISSFFITVIATILTLMKQTVGAITYKMIDGITLGVVIAVFIISTILLLISRNNN